MTADGDTSNRLHYLQASALLVADCLGVGILALPQDVHELGWGVGLGFLLLNLPINFHAGVVLADTALLVEANEQFGTVREGLELTEVAPNEQNEDSEGTSSENPDEAKNIRDGVLRRKSKQDGLFREKTNATKYTSVPNATASENHNVEDAARTEESSLPTVQPDENDDDDDSRIHLQNLAEEESLTSDFIGMTSVLFRQAHWTNLVLVIYMLNLTLVLGDYVLVMSHAVTAMVGENEICLPTAGILASILMFALSQLNTMSLLGREVSIISLLAAMIILIQCLVATHQPDATHKKASESDDDGPLRKFSALASIGFAIGSQKLFLNIRHEMKDRKEAHKTLFLSLITYGAACVAVTVAAGSDPPSFLFDAIPPGTGRRVAGFLLWGHVAVSYAINSQALCSSMDRLGLRHVPGLSDKPKRRWIILTFAMTLFSYLVSNAIPFFKDLVALIGALTSVPLSLTIPLLLHRKAKKLALFCLDKVASWPSFTSLLYSLVFLVIGLVGSLSSIERDWRLHGRPFSCH